MRGEALPSPIPSTEAPRPSMANLQTQTNAGLAIRSNAQTTITAEHGLGITIIRFEPVFEVTENGNGKMIFFGRPRGSRDIVPSIQDGFPINIYTNGTVFYGFDFLEDRLTMTPGYTTVFTFGNSVPTRTTALSVGTDAVTIGSTILPMKMSAVASVSSAMQGPLATLSQEVSESERSYEATRSVWTTWTSSTGVERETYSPTVTVSSSSLGYKASVSIMLLVCCLAAPYLSLSWLA
jgi:hypothetical protein